MKRFRLTGPAQWDLREIRVYISRDSPTAAARQVRLIRERCQRLAERPGIGYPRDELGSGIRGFTVGAYVILYRKSPDGIQVVRVLHGARDIEAIFREGGEA